jgi:hypothetical protein
VKAEEEAFRQQPNVRGKPSRPGLDDPAVVLRHEVERLHYAAGGIRTIQVTAEQFSPAVIANLRVLFMFHARRLDLQPAVAALILGRLHESVGTGVPGYFTVQELAQRHGVDQCTVLAIMYQAIWHRNLRVDLFSPIVMDQPLIPEREDVCVRYADIFGGDKP